MEKTGLRLSATSWSMDVIAPTILYPLFIIETCYQLSRGTAVIKLQALNNFCSYLLISPPPRLTYGIHTICL